MKTDENKTVHEVFLSTHGNLPEIGYVLKGYPRTSETFIAHEILMLERLGLKISIFSIMELAGQQRHAVFDSIQAPVTYLPQVSPVSGVPLMKWLAHNAPGFFRSHCRLFISRPGTYLKNLLEAVVLGFKYRSGSWLHPRKVFIREFLQAGFIAQNVLDSGKIRHLHAHFCHTSTSVAMVASRLCGIPFSFTAHAKDIYVGQLNPGDILQTKMRRAKFVVTCTRANSAYLQEISRDSAPVYTIYHGLDTRRFDPSEREKQRKGKPENPLILSVGRFVEKKGFTFLVEACRLLKDRGYDFRCMLIGGADSYQNKVEALIRELHLEETVLIRGAVTQEELKQLYEQGTAFVLPCQIVENGDRDGIPNVLVEAMAMELPVVSTDVSGIPELIDHGVNGLLVPQKNAAALADAIEMLLQSPSLRRQLGEAAREKVCRSFNAEDRIIELHDLFLSCLEPDEKVLERTLSSGSAANA